VKILVIDIGGLLPHTRAGSNANAFLGGFRLWQGEVAEAGTILRSK
jgi:hypothetical protein